MASNTGSNPGDVFDVRKVRRLVELMNDHDLAEIDLRQGEQRIRLRRGPEGQVVTAMPGVAPLAVPAPAVAPAPSSPVAAASAPAADSGTIIKSPMVGTYYSATSPEAAPFVKVGDQVGPETIVCIIEAMKVFNEIPAECSGKVVEVLVENGAAVEFGQPLIRLE